MKAYGTEERNKTLESRVEYLEAQIAEFKNLKTGPTGATGLTGPTGCRGPAGPIEAAVANAREATKQDLAETLKKSEELHQAVDAFNRGLESRIREVTDQAAAALRKRNDDFKQNIVEEVGAIVIKTLQDYWVLDSECRVLDHLQRPPVRGDVS
jgi:hypothetical protein